MNEYTVRESSMNRKTESKNHVWLVMYAGLIVDRYFSLGDANEAAEFLNNTPPRGEK